ncbi:MAG TPA: methyltransferase domain-containing protein [Pirellulales bacterium]|jgi:ubiquinone/menaquinone biosynthesis C-methylase UbiE|nr:methyltransferase domain-containing protein [Pirellulales bacterium]
MNEHAPVRRSYDDLAPSYDARWRKYIDATLALAMEPLELTGHERVLDVACGTGELELRLLGRWPALRVAGIDISSRMLRHAAEKGTGASLLAAESHRLPFGEGTFDVVISANAFHYFRRPEESLAEMRRVLRPAGRLVLVDWCDDYLSCKLCSVWLRWTDPAFHRTYSRRACRQMLGQSGFVVETTLNRRIDWLWGLMCLECTKPR